MPKTQPCAICKMRPSDSFHYGVLSCKACSVFFKRRMLKIYVAGKSFPMIADALTCRDESCSPKCSTCRLKRCLVAGMRADDIVKDEEFVEKFQNLSAETKALANRSFSDGQLPKITLMAKLFDDSLKELYKVFLINGPTISTSEKERFLDADLQVGKVFKMEVTFLTTLLNTLPSLAKLTSIELDLLFRDLEPSFIPFMHAVEDLRVLRFAHGNQRDKGRFYVAPNTYYDMIEDKFSESIARSKFLAHTDAKMLGGWFFDHYKDTIYQNIEVRLLSLCKSEEQLAFVTLLLILNRATTLFPHYKSIQKDKDDLLKELGVYFERHSQQKPEEGISDLIGFLCHLENSGRKYSELKVRQITYLSALRPCTHSYDQHCWLGCLVCAAEKAQKGNDEKVNIVGDQE
ncbi:hypothetical protein QR680_014684 [Steinernema hermaphroditum]|uniref:Nuclear receptor domain-containing protein n=1 Tax=Steinernema hermaphroditum TaxID=289476 RepID=A0AA39M4I2_9BILA|nr:hypothetical protein QR680_014684 [Steinernema hermaphroditum]